VSVRFKSLIIISATILVLMIALNYYSRVILMDSFKDLERDDLRQDVERILNLLSDDVASIDTLNHDWAAWDDTYRFIEDGNPAYVESNLMNQTFAGVNINVMLFLNAAGETIISKGLDIESMREIPVPAELVDYALANWDIFGTPDPEDHISGVVLIPQGAVMISAHQILDSEAQGPVRGRLIMGRYLDTTEIDRLSQLARLPITIRTLDEPGAPPDLKEAGTALLDGRDIVVKPISDDLVSGYGLLRDIQGQPILTVRTEVPRAIYAQGERALWFLTWALIGASVAVCAVSLVLLDRMVLKRLFKLRDDVGSIGKAGDPQARVSVTGNDEVTQLAGEVNVMLEALQRYQSEIAEKKALEAVNRQLVELNQLKSKFISMASHELRTPLVAIQGYLDLMRDGSANFSDEHARMLGIVSENTRRLTRIVSELLDLTKIEENRLILGKERVSVADLMETAASELGSSLRKRNLTLSAEIQQALPEITADRDRLAQVVINLVGNAIKYTPDGGHIRVGARLEGDATIHISVSDNGIGIESKHLERIFDRFYEIAEVTSHSTGTDEFMASGTGLGLSIVKEIVELHGGRVWCESEGKGKGATFHVVLPTEAGGSVANPERAEKSVAVRPVPATGTAETSPADRNGHLKVLVIEENEEAFAALKGVLDGKYELMSATTSGTGIKAAIWKKPDIIFLHARMPGVSGYDICSILKKHANTRSIPIIVFAQPNGDGESEKATTAGADAFLTVPFEGGELTTLVEGFRR